MSKSYNRVMLVGHLGKPPEKGATKGGTSISKFRIATNEVFKDKNGEKQENTDWHSIEVFGKTAEFCNEYLNTGSCVLIEGSLRTSTWEGDDGKTKSRVYVKALRVLAMDGKSDDQHEDCPI